MTSCRGSVRALLLYDIAEEIDLVPGPNKITFRAKTKNTEEAKSLILFYRPALPSLVFEPPPKELVYYELVRPGSRFTWCARERRNFRIVEDNQYCRVAGSLS